MSGEPKPTPDALKSVIRQIESEASEGGYALVAHLLGVAAEAVEADRASEVASVRSTGFEGADILEFPGRTRLDS